MRSRLPQFFATTRIAQVTLVKNVDNIWRFCLILYRIEVWNGHLECESDQNFSASGIGMDLAAAQTNDFLADEQTCSHSFTVYI